MFSRAWLLDSSERALRTFAQILLTLWGFGATGLNLFAVDWKAALEVAVSAAVLSLLTSVSATGVGESTSASLVRSVAPVGRHEKH